MTKVKTKSKSAPLLSKEDVLLTHAETTNRFLQHIEAHTRQSKEILTKLLLIEEERLVTASMRRSQADNLNAIYGKFGAPFPAPSGWGTPDFRDTPVRKAKWNWRFWRRG